MATSGGVTALGEESASTLFGVRRWLNLFVGPAWVINVALLIAAFGWVFLFGESRGIIELMRSRLGAVDPLSGIVVRDASRMSIGVTIGLVAIVVAAGTSVVMVASLFVGGSRFRTTRTWLLYTAVMCGWLGMLVAWPTVYWIGQQQRMKSVLPAAETFVAALQKGWPTVDSTLPDIGPFLAYPTNAPTALLPLTEAKFPKTAVLFSAVERTGDDVMRFELAGAEAGAWLEWRRDGSTPRSFVGGLDSEYVVSKAARLSPEWFLVRYRAAGLVERGARLSPQSR